MVGANGGYVNVMDMKRGKRRRQSASHKNKQACTEHEEVGVQHNDEQERSSGLSRSI